MTRAFDDVRPPSADVIADCVHCGFCLPTCPTYSLWGEEMDSPRGRIVLMRDGLEEGGELSRAMVTHLDRCLGCMACVTACPSGVRYDELIEDARPQIERNFERSWRERLVRRLVFETFPHPARLRALAPLVEVGRRLGLATAARRRRGGLLDALPRLRTLLALSPAASPDRPPKVTPARGPARASVALLQGCVQRTFFGAVNAATARVLAAEGFEVHAPDVPRCCGALQMHAGQDEPARELARRTIAGLERYDAVVVNAAGCGSAMKDYPHLLRDDPVWAGRARAFSARVRDVTELLAQHPPAAPRGEVRLRLAYHDACHLAHAQSVREQPRELLRAIPGVELVEPRDWEVCCGSAGIWNLVNPEPASELGRRKARNLIETGAEAVAAGNPGCALQITAHTEGLGRPLQLLHPVEILDMSIRAGAA
ncbi:MAG: 4Fe-4S dicluster domain-containing protein [Actinobacteria bacterium]|nr:4Fe-4S dicluster domain-containing protein [Actinomycetota bacterium]